MQEPDLFRLFTDPLNQLKIPYMVTGSVASILYGEPRLTHDIDLVIALKETALDAFCSAFPAGDFYCPPRDVILAEVGRSARGHFNLIHHVSGFKCDAYLVGSDPLHYWGLANARDVALEGGHLVVAPPEYVVVRKLEFYREGGSEKHVRDIQGMLELMLPGLDLAWLEVTVRERGLSNEWAATQSP